MSPNEINHVVQVKIKRVDPGAKIPTYGSDGAACFDLYPPFDVSVAYNRPATVDLGIQVEIPKGYGMFIYSRSGHGFKYDVRLANGTGIIDSDYRGNVMVKLTCDDPADRKGYLFTADKAIAQAVVMPVPRTEFVEATELNSTERGDGGFGSTDAPRIDAFALDDRQKMQRALCDLKEYAGTSAAKQIMHEVGGVAKMAYVPDDLVKRVTAAAELRAHMERIVSEAQKFGLVLTVLQVAKPSLAMGNYETEVSIRAARA